jgi:hypothetical protein
LFEAFIEHKFKSVTPSTPDKYRVLLSCLKEYFKERPAAGVGIAEAEKFTKSKEARLFKPGSL